jgi:chitin biosynthesis protein CHS5
VTLEWGTIQLATASLRSLDIYRSGQRLASIPNPTTNTSTKLSSLQIATKYTFQLILRTTAGTYPSNVIEVRTHTIEDTSGISVCFGTILDSDVSGGADGEEGGGGGSGAKRKEELKTALEEMGAKWSEKIQIDTTHFVCTTSLSLAAVSTSAGVHSSASVSALQAGEEPGVEYQKAMQLSIPIVQPDWVLACYYGKK